MSANYQGKMFGHLPLFQPSEGRLVRAPLGDGPEWWAGAPCATFDAPTNMFYLVYRQRQPRELGRGIECRIAASDNGVAFKDIWALPRTSLAAYSVERCALLRGLDGRWRLYLSYLAEEDRQWRIGLVEADEPDGFDLSRCETLLAPSDLRASRIKDANVFQIGPLTYLTYSYADEGVDVNAPVSLEAGESPTVCLKSGAVSSGDGRHFGSPTDITPDMTPIFRPRRNTPTAGEPNDAPLRRSWDAHSRRITALTPLETGGWIAFYDGCAGPEENYHERTGMAFTADLLHYRSLTPDAPALASPYANGCLRFLDVLPVGQELFYYYEMAREDGAHELRVSVVDRDSGY